MGEGWIGASASRDRKQIKQNAQLVNTAASQQQLMVQQNQMLAQQIQMLTEQTRLLKFMADTLNRMENRQISAEQRTG